MKILLLAQFFPPDVGGEERHAFNLANALADRGHDVAVATQLLPHTKPVETLESGVTVHRFISSAMKYNRRYLDAARPHHLPIPDPGLTAELSQLVGRLRPDVVHAHNWIVNSAVALRRGGRHHPRFGLVLTLHDYSHVCATKRMMRRGSPCGGPRPGRCLDCAVSHYGAAVGVVTAAAVPVMRRWKDRSVDHIVSVSTEVARRNAVADSRTPSSVIPNFIPDALLADVAGQGRQASTATGNGAGFIFFAGDLTRDKGALALRDAYESLAGGRPDLLMVGRRHPDTPDTLPAGARAEAEWPHDRIIEAFRRCVFAVVPSICPDACPTTVLEAMACGRAVVATRTGGIVDLVQDQVTGLLVPPDDVRALAGAMRRLIDDPGLNRRLGETGRQRVRDFTASSVARRLENIYQGVMDT